MSGDNPQPDGRTSGFRVRIKEILSRLAVLALCLGGAIALWGLGHHIRTTGVYDYTLETGSGDELDHTPGRDHHVTREVVHATGDWALEQGFGFEAAGIGLLYWGVLIVWGMAGPLALRAEWSPIHSVVTAVSLACWSTALFAFFPPWRIGWSMSCNAFYLVLAACLYLSTLRDRAKLLAHSQKVFPALIGSAVVLGSFSSGYFVGIIAGILSCLLLAVHIVLLIPKVRAEFWTPGEASAATA